MADASSGSGTRQPSPDPATGPQQADYDDAYDYDYDDVEEVDVEDAWGRAPGASDPTALQPTPAPTNPSGIAALGLGTPAAGAATASGDGSEPAARRDVWARHGRDGARGRLGRRARVVLALIFPIAVLAGVAALTTQNLNGTSVALAGVDPTDESSMLAGHAQRSRTDEYAESTPNTVGNERRGLPVQPWIGLTQTYLPATSIGVPSKHWTEAFKPHDWGVFALDVGHAVALRWWTMLAEGLLGTYWLLWLLTRRALLSIGLAVLATCTPYVAWWSMAPASVLGFAAAGTACTIMALRAGRWFWTMGWALAAGYFATAFVLVLYPPWQVSLAWVGLAVVLGILIDERPKVWRVGLTAAGVAVVVLPALAAWFVQGEAGIDAVRGTTHPGQRTSGGGGGALTWMLSPPSSLWLSRADAPTLQTADVSAAGKRLTSVNPTEISSTWLPLPLLVVAVVALIWLLFLRRPPDDARALTANPEDPELRWTGLLVALALALLLVWALVPVPEDVGRYTLLSQVPGRRIPLAAGLAAAILLAVAADRLRAHRMPVWLASFIVLGGAGSAAAFWWGTSNLPWDNGRPADRAILIVADAFAAGFTVIVLGRLSGLAAIATAGAALVVFAMVNPLYRGLGPLTDDPLVAALRQYGMPEDPARAMVFDHHGELTPLVAASGVQNLSGVTVYPDAAFWEGVAPTQKDLWNNVARYVWVADPTATHTVIRQVQGTWMQLTVNPCAPEVESLQAELAVSADPIRAPCLTLLRQVTRSAREDPVVYLYQVGTG